MPSGTSVLSCFRSFDRASQQRLCEVLSYAQIHLTNLIRRGGETYAQNGEEVAATLTEITDDPSLVAIALLHDLLTHPQGAALLQQSPLTADEQGLVQRMHLLRGRHIDLVSQDLDAVIHAFLEEPRLLPLRMAHRLTDIRHLDRFSKKDQRAIARETLHMYTAMAGRLGMHAWRHEMEDACFRFLHPEAAKSLEQQFALHKDNDEECFRQVQHFLQQKFQAVSMQVSMSSRMKTLYSAYCKMIVKHRRFEELTDRLALRIVVSSVDECYRALGVVHTALRPMPGKLKDYIGAPKENGYRSIHTVIYPLAGVTEYPMEIQIRTPSMHQECEFGPARHVDYKHYTYAFGSTMTRVDLFRNLQSLREHTRSPKQFASALRTYFNEDHIALFDHHNHLYHLAKPVSALDFVCHIAGKRVRYLREIRINGRTRSLRTLLRDGDTIESIFSKQSQIHPDWLRGCQQGASRTLCNALLREKA